MHTLTPSQMQQLLGSAEALRLSPAARQRLLWISEFVQNGRSISETCAHFGIARSTFHRWLERFDPNNLSSLEERAHDPVKMRTSTVTPEQIALIRNYREQSPLMGKQQLRELLLKDHSIELSDSTIGRVIERECLYFAATPLHWRKRAAHAARAQVQTVVQTVQESVTPTIIASEIPAAHAAVCACVWCSFWGTHWKVFRRSLALTSLIVNLAFIGAFMATVFWEKQERVKADLINTDTDIHSTLDLQNDGR